MGTRASQRARGLTYGTRRLDQVLAPILGPCFLSLPLILPHGQVQPYQVRVSTLARYLRIQISASTGVVVLPSHQGMLESVSTTPNSFASDAAQCNARRWMLRGSIPLGSRA